MGVLHGQADVRVLLDEQAALRRVATLVAGAGDAASVFSSVTEEVGRLLAAQTANMVRYHHDNTADVVGAWSAAGAPRVEVGGIVELDGETIAPRIYRSGRPERVDDYGELAGGLAARLRALGLRAGVGAPIVLNGELWGAVMVSSFGAPFAVGDEHRIGAFTELVAHALANADARAELTASRARIVTAGD